MGFFDLTAAEVLLTVLIWTVVFIGSALFLTFLYSILLLGIAAAEKDPKRFFKKSFFRVWLRWKNTSIRLFMTILAFILYALATFLIELIPWEWLKVIIGLIRLLIIFYSGLFALSTVITFLTGIHRLPVPGSSPACPFCRKAFFPKPIEFDNCVTKCPQCKQEIKVPIWRL